MKVIYICTPYRAADKETLERNIEYARELTRKVLMQGNAPIATHLYMTQCLSEDAVDERNIGLRAGIELLQKCDEVLVGYKYGISEGMEHEMSCAKDNGIRIRYLAD